jgi:Probable cobalt transporter subunit (CbtA)
MVGALLTRGMLIGILAAILAFGFLKIAGEPSVDRAIAFEAQMDKAKAQARKEEAAAKGLPAPIEEVEPELVSRAVQAGIGLLTGVAVYNVAFGGLFALAFVLAYGRMGSYAPRAASALLAISGIIAVYIVPNLKYPANPPSVGDPDTIGTRTALYFSMIAISLVAMLVAWMLRNRLIPSLGAWNAALIASGAYLAMVVIAALHFLPSTKFQRASRPMCFGTSGSRRSVRR